MPDDTFSDLLYLQYAQKIFAYLRKQTLAREDAEDILLEVFLAAMEQANFSLLSEQEQLAWLLQVAHNKAMDVFRRTTRYPRVSIEQIAESAYEQVELSPEQTILYE